MSKEILFFSSPWCGPCKNMKDILNESIQEKMNIKIIDISVDMDKAAEYQVMNVPTFVVLENGKEVSRKIGATTINSLKHL